MDAGHHSATISPQTATGGEPAPPDALGARITLNDAPDPPRSPFRWRPEELFASETTRGGIASLAVVSVILGTVGLVASAVAIVYHGVFAYSFSLRKTHQRSPVAPVETTTNVQFPTITNPRRRLYLQSYAAESSHSGSAGNLPDDSRSLARAPLMSRAPSASTTVSKGSSSHDTTSSVPVNSSRSGTPACLDPGGWAQSQCAEFGCSHATLAGSTTNSAAAIGAGRAGNSSSAPAAARHESLSGQKTHVAAICSHNRACATAPSSGGNMTAVCSPSHSQADTLIGDIYEFGHEYPGVLRHALASHHNGPGAAAKGGRDKGRKMGGFRRIREAFGISRASNATSTTVTSDDGRYSSSDHRRYNSTEGAGGRVASGKSDGVVNSPHREPAPLPPLSGPHPPSPPDLVPTSFPDQLSSPSQHVSVSASPETSTSLPYPSVMVTSSALTSSAIAPYPQPRTSVPVFHRPNILKRPSSPLCPRSSIPTPPSRTLTLPPPPPGALQQSATTNADVSGGTRQGKVKKCGKKAKPPPLRTAYTYTFAPVSTSPGEYSHSDSREASDVEGGVSGQRTLYTDNDGGDEPSAQRRSFSLELESGASRGRPRTASGDDQLDQSRRRRSSGMKQSTMRSDKVVPIFVQLAPRVAGSLPTGVSVVNSSFSGSAAPSVPASAPPTTSQSRCPIQGGPDRAASVGPYATSAATILPVVGDVAIAGLGSTGVDELGRKVYHRSMPPPPRCPALTASSVPLHMVNEAFVPPAPATSDLEPERVKDKRKASRRFSLR